MRRTWDLKYSILFKIFLFFKFKIFIFLFSNKQYFPTVFQDNLERIKYSGVLEDWKISLPVSLTLFFFFLFIGNALLRRLVRIGVLDEGKMKLDYILGLKIEDFLERRLQTQVFKLGLAKSIHHARVLIRQRHIR